MKLADDISSLPGVGKARKELLYKLLISTLGDLVLHIPVRFIDRRYFTPVSSLVTGNEAVVVGEIVSVTRNRSGRGPVISAVLSDETGSISLTFFQKGFPGSKLCKGLNVIACGVVEIYKGFSIVHPDLYFLNDKTGKITPPGMLPVYPLTAGITQVALRKLVNLSLDLCEEEFHTILPLSFLMENGFDSKKQVVRSAHNPSSPEEAEAARQVLAVEELYLYKSLLTSLRLKSEKYPGLSLHSFSLADFEQLLPWSLTVDQKKVCRDIEKELLLPFASRRLVQGDVGSGKTVVALFAALIAVKSGKTSVLLAPTEVLAAQHYKQICKFCSSIGLKIHLLTGGTSKAARNLIGLELAETPGAILIGTHAVLEDWVPLDSLGLLIIDEQHKFGVAQREKLLSDRNPKPHLLVMSATPIPRSLAMTLYGDLNLSVIRSMPPGRGKIVTQVISSAEKREIFNQILDRLRAGERCFLVYPLKETSEKIDLLDASSAFDIVNNGPMVEFGVGLLHGSMLPEDKLSVTEDFSNGKISVLVSTTVIEVGIDVPEATVMVIANAERFGLSQLHQLRGRIGRGGQDSSCFLVPGEKVSHEALQRLHFLASTTDGFIIAQKDLEIRGPGQVLGTAQHGIPEFRIADLKRDSNLLHIVNSLTQPSLEELRQEVDMHIWSYFGTGIKEIMGGA